MLIIILAAMFVPMHGPTFSSETVVGGGGGGGSRGRGNLHFCAVNTQSSKGNVRNLNDV